MNAVAASNSKNNNNNNNNNKNNNQLEDNNLNSGPKDMYIPPFQRRSAFRTHGIKPLGPPPKAPANKNPEDDSVSSIRYGMDIPPSLLISIPPLYLTISYLLVSLQSVLQYGEWNALAPQDQPLPRRTNHQRTQTIPRVLPPDYHVLRYRFQRVYPAHQPATV